MKNQDYEIYQNIMSTTPVIDKNYLSDILHIVSDEKIDFIEITKVIESNTALIIKISAHIQKKNNKYTKRLFIKTMKQDKAGNVYHKMSMKEGKFYQLINANKVKNIPVPTCYDVFLSREKGEFVIVLEDVSERFVEPDIAASTDNNIWYSCAASLAQFHAAFWDHEIIPVKIFEHDDQADRECLRSFLGVFRDQLDSKTKLILEKAMEINIALIHENLRRMNNRENITICNGDSHIYNFLQPIEKSGNPLIIDFQFWRAGIGVGDLAHLTRVRFCDELKRDIQFPLVEHYYKTLSAHGVFGYSWENCLHDYRMNAASMVLIPLWQYSGFQRKYDDWIGDLRGLIYNYEYLKCDELL